MFLVEIIADKRSASVCNMYSRHDFPSKQRLTCARTDQPYGNLIILKLGSKKLKQVSQVKFLGVIIDKIRKWEAHLEYLENKLKLSIVMIKRIKKFIPKK